MSNLVSLFNYIKYHMCEIMLLAGAVLLVTGLLTLTIFGSVLSAASLFFGVLFVVFGLFVQIGLLPEDIRSLGGLGTILLCISIVFITFSLSMLQFSVITSTEIVAVPWRGTVIGWRLVVHTERPYEWASVLFMQLGLAILIVGIAIKIFNALRSRGGP